MNGGVAATSPYSGLSREELTEILAQAGGKAENVKNPDEFVAAWSIAQIRKIKETPVQKPDPHTTAWGWMEGHSLVLRKDRETLQQTLNPIVKECELSDLGNAARISRRYGAVVKYCHTFNSWFIWDGRRWARDQTQFIREIAKDTVRRIAAEADISDGKDRENLWSWAGTCQSRSRIENMISLAESSLPITHDHLDKPTHLFNVWNGTLNLLTFQLQEHKPSDNLTKISTVEFIPGASCLQWEDHLNLVFGGDSDLISGFQEMIGYCLLAGNPESSMNILYGSGKNGKSVTLAVLRDVFGDYSCNIASESLMVKKNPDAPRSDIARTLGSRLITASEGESGALLAESLVKQLTGGDAVTVRRLYESEFEFVPVGKIFLCTNHRPVVRGTDFAIWRRLWLWPFTVKIPDEKCDPHITDKLIKERSGILNWALAGLKRYYEDGSKLVKPGKVAAATQEYQSASDILAEFIKDRCVLQGEITRATLRSEYLSWCHQQNENPLGSRRFNDSIRDRGVGEKTIKGERYWVGISLSGQERFT